MTAVEVALRDAGQRPPRDYNGPVSAESVRECEESHKSANGSSKAPGERHDDKGVMAMVCRHDIPLFVAMIMTAGERQHYPIALIIWFLLHLPDVSTAAILYDIACVTDRTLAVVGSHRCRLPLDGEGCERLWSRIRKLIPILLHMHVSSSVQSATSPF